MTQLSNINKIYIYKLEINNYNHETTNLAINTMKHLKISCPKHKIGSLLLSSRYMTNYMKTCSFLHAGFTETMKVFENLF